MLRSLLWQDWRSGFLLWGVTVLKGHCSVDGVQLSRPAVHTCVCPDWRHLAAALSTPGLTRCEVSSRTFPVTGAQSPPLSFTTASPRLCSSRQRSLINSMRENLLGTPISET